MNESFAAFNYHAKEANIVKVSSPMFNDWEKAIKDNLNTKVIACVLILPGVKGCPNGLYTMVKRLLLTEIPVPSQVILSSTIEKSKSALFSITTRLL